MPDKTARGRFVWHELTVPEESKAHEFYTKVVGWKTQPSEHDPNYQMFAASTGGLGGSVKDADSPPHWLLYIGTNDIEATVKRASELGATVVKDISALANGGRWARLNDPQGAAFGIYQSTQKPGREKPPKRGEFSWYELATTDYTAAFDFYSELFGWEKSDEVDMGPELGKYFMFTRSGPPLGGMFNLMPEMKGPFWLGYIRVKDVNKAVKKVKAAGGTLINGPMEVPGGDWIAQFTDSQGAMFAVHVVKDDLQAPGESTSPVQVAPAQGTLDFPPADTAGPETVAVAAQAPKKSKAAKPTVETPAAAVQKSGDRTSSSASSKSKTAPQKKAAAKSRKAAKPAAKKAGAKTAASKKGVGKKANAKSTAKKSAKPAAKKGAKKKAVPAKRSKAPKKKARKGK